MARLALIILVGISLSQASALRQLGEEAVLSETSQGGKDNAAKAAAAVEAQVAEKEKAEAERAGEDHDASGISCECGIRKDGTFGAMNDVTGLLPAQGLGKTHDKYFWTDCGTYWAFSGCSCSGCSIASFAKDIQEAIHKLLKK